MRASAEQSSSRNKQLSTQFGSLQADPPMLLLLRKSVLSRMHRYQRILWGQSCNTTQHNSMHALHRCIHDRILLPPLAWRSATKPSDMMTPSHPPTSERISCHIISYCNIIVCVIVMHHIILYHIILYHMCVCFGETPQRVCSAEVRSNTDGWSWKAGGSRLRRIPRYYGRFPIFDSGSVSRESGRILDK